MIVRDNDNACHVCKKIGFAPYITTTMGKLICDHDCWIRYLEGLSTLQKSAGLMGVSWDQGGALAVARSTRAVSVNSPSD